MATLQASTFLSSSSSSSASRRAVIKANLCRSTHSANLSVPQCPVEDLIDELNRKNGFQTIISTTTSTTHSRHKPNSNSNSNTTKAVEELYAIMDVVADRAEMHKNIGTQRDNWNHLLLTSINGMTVTAAMMAGLAAVSGGVGAPLLALKLSSTLLYASVTGVLMVMNRIQPSQLAEEQRNASRLFKQLHEQIKSTIALRNRHLTMDDVNDATEKVLALDRAYPLPLIGTMLDKFPKTVEPAVWWPKQLRTQQQSFNGGRKVKRNGWSQNLEEEMKEVVGVLKRKDSAEYLRLSQMALRLNMILAISGPLLTGLAAFASAFVGSPWHGSWAVVLGVTFGALATVVNTLEHGGQVGMVFEMYRSSAGFFKLMEETIESTLTEREADRRENGEVFETEVALKLGRSPSELRHLASASSSSSSSFISSSLGIAEATEEFASKLF
uniref:F-box protein n=1 Tax=Davidia involucrata TaxID=16924 RepID=A0A5B7CBY3_DAVIN